VRGRARESDIGRYRQGGKETERFGCEKDKEREILIKREIQAYT
jgi:hypothetical protein